MHHSIYSITLSGKVMFGKATVTLSDVTAGNGVVHAIDEVLFATPQLSQLSKPTFKPEVNKRDKPVEQKRKNLVELCKDLGFTSFAAAMALTGIDKVADPLCPLKYCQVLDKL